MPRRILEYSTFTTLEVVARVELEYMGRSAEVAHVAATWEPVAYSCIGPMTTQMITLLVRN